MKTTTAFAAAVLVFALLLTTPAVSKSKPESKQQSGKQTAKYVIVMVPDGMGLFDVTATRIKKNGIAGAQLALETLDHVGYVRTYSADSTVTDSAASASAYACGEKFNNGEICLHADGKPHPTSLLEIAKQQGRGTGLVVTSSLTDATPAAFAAHVKSRKCETEIARQMVTSTQPDVMLGGGKEKFTTAIPDFCGTSGDFAAAAKSAGYKVVNTADELRSESSSKHLLGLFAPNGLTPEYKRTPGISEPRLPDMARTALGLLEKNRNGFFLLIEGSQVDWGNHANNLEYQAGEMLAFDETVKAVLDWINADPKRKQETLLIIVPDHETGGFVLKPDEKNPTLGAFTAGWNTKGHTGGDVVFWSQGPGSDSLAKGVQNTDIYSVVKQALK